MPLPIIPILGGVLVLLGLIGRRGGLLVPPAPSPTIIHNHHYHGAEPNESSAPAIDSAELRRRKAEAAARRKAVRDAISRVDENPFEAPSDDGDGENG